MNLDVSSCEDMRAGCSGLSARDVEGHLTVAARVEVDQQVAAVGLEKFHLEDAVVADPRVMQAVNGS